MQKILVATPATIRATFYVGETPTDVGAVTVAVTKADGTAVAGVGVVSTPSPGVYEAALPAQDGLNMLQATWTAATRTVTTYHEIVGGFYAELAEIRALDALANVTKYPTAKLEVARAQAEDRFQDATGVSWVPRFEREYLDGDNTARLRLTRPRPRDVLAVTINAAVVADLTGFRLYEWGAIERAAGAVFTREVAGGGRNVVVEYTHGYDQPPEDIRQAFLVYVRYLLLDSNSRIPDRASVMSTDMGTFQLTTAGYNRPVGLPDVDAVLMSHNHNIPGVAA